MSSATQESQMPATHTPAPWTVTDQHSDYVMSVVRRGNGMPDLQTGSVEDAALIAAAPDLLAALTHIDALDPQGAIHGISEHVARGLVLRMGEIARAAIAKATAQ